jgi:hypothetical protein
MKRLFLHIGAGKTGTSAIQRLLATIEPQLGRFSYSYPISPRLKAKALRSVSRGNGVELALLLGCAGSTKILRQAPRECETLTSWVEQNVLMNDCSAVIFSSEMLQFPSDDKLKEFSVILSQHQICLHIIYYVRHASDYVISCYLQHLKLGFPNDFDNSIPKTLNGFLAVEVAPYRRTLESYMLHFPNALISTISFDAFRSCLFESFLDSVGLPQILASACLNAQVNRSLSPSEMIALEYLFGVGMSKKNLRDIGQLLINGKLSRLDIVEIDAFPVSQYAIDEFAKSSESVVDWVNDKQQIRGSRVELINSKGFHVRTISRQLYKTAANGLIEQLAFLSK